MQDLSNIDNACIDYTNSATSNSGIVMRRSQRSVRANMLKMASPEAAAEIVASEMDQNLEANMFSELSFSKLADQKTH
jgi:hypothetical protein